MAKKKTRIDVASSTNAAAATSSAEAMTGFMVRA